MLRRSTGSRRHRVFTRRSPSRRRNLLGGSMSVSRSLRLPIFAVIAVLLSTITVAVATPAHPSTSKAGARADALVAATTANGYASRVIGSFAHGGTVRGSFVPVRSYVIGGKTVVQGELLATLRRANGSLVGGVTRNDVSLPVHASGASRSAAAAPAAAAAACPLLHLVLGPLHLNLLGLNVNLNRVVLDITAQSGPGNLLGNLLCAVAHLLDGSNPSLLNL